MVQQNKVQQVEHKVGIDRRAVAEESGGFCPCLPNINSKGETPMDAWHKAPMADIAPSPVAA